MKKIVLWTTLFVCAIGCGARTGLNVQGLCNCPRPTPPNPSQPIRYGDIIRLDVNTGYPGYCYYIGRNGNRYVIPDDRNASPTSGFFFPGRHTADSWNMDDIVIRPVPRATLASVMISGNVPLRAGTYLVRISTDPAIYVITPGGVLHRLGNDIPIASDALPRLYGLNWHDRVLTISDANFVASYTLGAPASQTVHAEGTLISYASEPGKIYYVTRDGHRRLITPGGFCANRFGCRWVVMTTIAYPDGPPITAREPAIADMVYVP